MTTERPYRICTRCVMDTSDPDITFDAIGRCSNCRQFEEDLKRRLVPPRERETALAAVTARIRADGRGRDYDCIIGVSGGTDSTYLAQMARQLGLRVLAVHFDNGWDSERAVRNIERMLKKLGIDLHTVVMDWEQFRDIQVAFLRASTPDGEVPTDHAILSVLYHVAAEHGIKYILDGSNFATEGLLPRTSWAYGHLDWRYIKGVHRTFGTRAIPRYPHMGVLRLAYYVLVKRIAVVSLLNYIAFRKDVAMATLARDVGWEDYGGKHCESIYTKFYQSYVLPAKFNIDKRRAHLSSLLVSSGELTREDALSQLETPPLSESELREERAYVIKKLGLTEEEFAQIMVAPVRTFRDYKNGYPVFVFRKRLLRFLRAAKWTYR